MPKSAVGARAAPPAITWAMPNSSASRPRPSRMSAGAVGPVTAPHLPPSISIEYVPARDWAGSGACPPS
eukprot:4323975-Pleurochrysis_carterae.AAC.1